MEFKRSSAFYLYLAVLAGLVLAITVWDRPFDASHPDRLVEVVYLFMAVLALELAGVCLDPGHLTFGAVAVGAAIIFTNPVHATIIAPGIALGQRLRGARGNVWDAILSF